MASEERETGKLIGSDKVEGTAVFGPDGERIGSIERIMIDKLSGKASYAVLGFGGFLGIGNEYYPLTWSTLKYNTQLDGYQVALTEDQLRGAPKYADEDDWNWANASGLGAIDTYYGALWGMPVSPLPTQRSGELES
jgi:hypothetical protein